MRETDERVTCECGRWRWAGAVDGWGEQYHHRHSAVRGHEPFYCWRCHTELFCDAAGNPVARAMIPADETLAESIARQQADPEKGGLAAVVGKWPGDESDAEIEEALAAMRGRAPDDEYHECAGYGFDVHAYIRESLSEAARLRRELAEYREAYRDADDGCRKLEAEVATLEAGAVLPRHSKHALVMVEVALQNNTSPLPSQVQAVIAALRRIIRGVTTLEEGMEVSRILTDAGLDYIPDLPAKEDKP